MGDVYVTKETARSHFLFVVKSVCPEAFDDLTPLVEEFRRYFLPDPPSQESDYYMKLIRQIARPDDEAGYISQSDAELNVLREELLAILTSWLERWHLNGEAEREWVFRKIAGTLGVWAIRPHFPWLVNFEIDEKCPHLNFPELSIDNITFGGKIVNTHGNETWHEFTQRAKRELSGALREYRTALNEDGEFKRQAERPAIWLAKYQVAGLSWREVADTQHLEADDREPTDYNDSRELYAGG